jgi:hypothetical protein
VVEVSPEAAEQIRRLNDHYVDLKRSAALRNLADALHRAKIRIATRPLEGLPAPRPYPDLADLGLRWIKEASYWIAYDPAGTSIAGIFYDTANIPAGITTGRTPTEA